MSKKDSLGNSADTPVPYWILAPHEDKQIRDECEQQTYKLCADQFIRMGKCTEKHQVLFSWYCKDLKKELLDCVAHWGSFDQYDKLREKFIEKKRAELINEGKINTSTR